MISNLELYLAVKKGMTFEEFQECIDYREHVAKHAAIVAIKTVDELFNGDFGKFRASQEKKDA